MPSRPPKRCRVCGRSAEEAGGISWRGYCPEHGVQRIEEAARQISAGVGPFALHQARRQELAARRRRVAMEKAMLAGQSSEGVGSAA